MNTHCITHIYTTFMIHSAKTFFCWYITELEFSKLSNAKREREYTYFWWVEHFHKLLSDVFILWILSIVWILEHLVKLRGKCTPFDKNSAIVHLVKLSLRCLYRIYNIDSIYTIERGRAREGERSSEFTNIEDGEDV